MLADFWNVDGGGKRRSSWSRWSISDMVTWTLYSARQFGLRSLGGQHFDRPRRWRRGRILLEHGDAEQAAEHAEDGADEYHNNGFEDEHDGAGAAPLDDVAHFGGEGRAPAGKAGPQVV